MHRIYLPMFAGALLASCGASEPDYSGSYVGGDQTAIIQLQLVESADAKINGSISVASVDYEVGKLQSTTKAITGLRKGSRLSLLAHGGGMGVSDSPLSLDAKGNSLLLNVPATGQTLELTRMDQKAYRAKLIELASVLNANDVGLVPED